MKLMIDVFLSQICCGGYFGEENLTWDCIVAAFGVCQWNRSAIDLPEIFCRDTNICVDEQRMPRVIQFVARWPSERVLALEWCVQHLSLHLYDIASRR